MADGRPGISISNEPGQPSRVLIDTCQGVGVDVAGVFCTRKDRDGDELRAA